jgi:Right handed beta helix region
VPGIHDGYIENRADDTRPLRVSRDVGFGFIATVLSSTALPATPGASVAVRLHMIGRLTAPVRELLPGAASLAPTVLVILGVGLIAAFGVACGGARANSIRIQPVISGDVRLHHVLILSNWSRIRRIGRTPPRARYPARWQDCDPYGNGCHDIIGGYCATAQAACLYRVQEADNGDTLRVVVSGGPLGDVRSEQTAIVPGKALYVAARGPYSMQCTFVAPCPSLSQANLLATAGATVHVAPGLYAGATLWRDGTRDERITYVSTVHWGAVIIPQLDVRGDYVTIDGFDIDGRGAALHTDGIALDGSHSAALYNHVHGFALPCASGGAIGAGTGNEPDGPYTSHDQTILGNVIDHYGAGPYGAPAGGACQQRHGIYVAVARVTVANNLIFDISADGISSYHRMTHATIVNNTIFGVGGNGIYLGANEAPSSHNYVANNVVDDVGLWCLDTGGTQPVSAIWRNNDEARCDRGATGGVSSAVDNLTLAPRFEDVAKDDFRLRATSPDVDSGTSAGPPKMDIGGVPRPQGRRVDRGCYER